MKVKVIQTDIKMWSLVVPMLIPRLKEIRLYMSENMPTLT